MYLNFLYKPIKKIPVPRLYPACFTPPRGFKNLVFTLYFQKVNTHFKDPFLHLTAQSTLNQLSLKIPILHGFLYLMDKTGKTQTAFFDILSQLPRIAVLANKNERAVGCMLRILRYVKFTHYFEKNQINLAVWCKIFLSSVCSSIFPSFWLEVCDENRGKNNCVLRNGDIWCKQGL